MKLRMRKESFIATEGETEQLFFSQDSKWVGYVAESAVTVRLDFHP